MSMTARMLRKIQVSIAPIMTTLTTSPTRGFTGAGPSAGQSVVVGVDLEAGQSTQALVPAGTWQRTLPGPDDALVSCLVSPGFDFADFELA